MRAYYPKTFLLKRFAEGWRCHGEADILTANEPHFREINFSTYGKLRFLTYVRCVFGLRKKARAMRAPRGVRTSKGWAEDF